MQDNTPFSDEAKAWVLVVDDEEAITRLFSRGLSHAGYEVAVAHSGEEALAQLQSRRFDVLLSDIHMPRMHGDELQRRALELDPDIAVLLMTGAQDTALAVECLKEGAYDYLMKPTSLSDVAVRVKKALERRQMALQLRQYQVSLEKQVAAQAERLRRMLHRSLESLIHALEAKDPYTRNHSQRVSAVSTALAERLCPGDVAFVTKVRVASLFHDIGKIGVPEAILNKPGKLDEEEMAQVRRHPVLSEQILRPLLEGEAQMLAIVRSHHERWDGGGYPDGFMGEETEPGACIVAVADAYDAMTSARPYRPVMPVEQALQVLQEGAGVQWDADVVETLLEMAESGELSRVLAREEESLTLPTQTPAHLPQTVLKAA